MSVPHVRTWSLLMVAKFFLRTMSSSSTVQNGIKRSLFAAPGRFINSLYLPKSGECATMDWKAVRP